MRNRSLVSINDYSKEEILQILDLTSQFEKNPVNEIMKGKLVANLFFEPSTRTRLSFESSVIRMGGQVIGFSDANSSSVSKGETLKDTIKTVSNYSDLIVMRHPLEGSAKYASEISKVPIINAGDGAHQHPTQTLLDLYSIRKTQGQLEDLTITLIGDLKYGRTVHSLLMAMSHFNPTFHFVAPEKLQMPDEYKFFLRKLGIKYCESKEISDSIETTDIMYMTRVQRERFTDEMDYEKVKNSYIISNETIENSKETMKILHPLPRVNEINIEVDDNPKAYYFEQTLNGVYTRQAIIASILDLV